MPFNQPKPADKAGTMLTASGATGTLTLPAVANYKHYITNVEISRINTTTTAIPSSGLVNVATTNLNGVVYTIGNALNAGETVEVIRDYSNPIQSQTTNTPTTFVVPAGVAGVQYRVNVFYYLGE